MQTIAIIKRNNQIYRKYLKGKTRTELAKEYNISRERIARYVTDWKYNYLKITRRFIGAGLKFNLPCAL